MDITSKTFLTVLKSALLGESADCGRELLPQELQKLFEMAQIHQLLPMFYEALYQRIRKEELPAAAAVKQQVMRQVMRQTIKTSEFFALNRNLQASGVKPLVVKGIICRNLYPKPDLRASGDEDILIPPAQFAACHEVLTAFGMQTTTKADTLAAAYEVPYRKAESPLYIELHKHLFPPEAEAYADLNRFFDGVFERAVEVDIQGNRVYTMEYTDHLFYLICHAYKHFLHSGFGIRQVCDIIMFANRYGSQIDWLCILKNCREIRADRFAAAIFQIGRKYLTFDPEMAAWPREWRGIDVDETALLEDLLSGGLYGDANLSRKHSSNMTLAAVAAQKQGSKTKNGVLASAFPPADKLERRYPYLKKRPYLLPVAWCDRLWKYSRETRNTVQNSTADTLRIGNERIALLKQYGILE